MFNDSNMAALLVHKGGEAGQANELASKPIWPNEANQNHHNPIKATQQKTDPGSSLHATN